MTCQTVMLPDPVTALDSSTLADAIDSLFRNKIKTLPVVDASGLYKGLFGAHTLVRHALPRAATLADDNHIGDLAFVHDSLENIQERLTSRLGESVLIFSDTELRPLEPDMSLVETLLHLHRHHHNLPVVDAKSGRLLGLVTYWAILAKLTGRPA